MRWSTDLPDYGKLEEGVAGSAMLDRIEWSFHLDLARAPILDAVEECGIQARRYGPVLAMVLGALTEETRFNRVLGAAAPRAATGGHLSEALDWVESFGVDARIPGEALGIDPLANCFLDCIPLREGWSGYLARDPDDGAPSPGGRRALVLQG